MALLDILTGGQHTPADAAASPRVPPLAKALAELFAYKQTGNGPTGTGPSISDRLDDFFKPSASGGPTGKGLMGALLTGGLMDVVAQFRGAGKGSVVDSWVGSGANTPVSPTDLSSTLSEEQIAFLMKRTGMSREELLAGLSDRLPKVVDALTPEGRIPTADEVTKRI
jgi:uncharacterized protein YidB (DUF937 family)